MAKKALQSQQILDSIRRIVRALRTFSKSTEKEFGLSTAQIYVLQKLVDSKLSMSVNELAEATLTHQSSVSVVVAKLVERNLIERTVNETDSRSFRLTITDEGRYLLSKSPMSLQERLTTAIEKMNRKDRDGLVRGLQSLLRNAGMEDDDAPMLMEDDGAKSLS